MQRDILLLSEMVDAAEQAQRLVAALVAFVGGDTNRSDMLDQLDPAARGQQSPSKCRQAQRNLVLTLSAMICCRTWSSDI